MERRGRLSLFLITIPTAVVLLLLLRNVFVDDQVLETAARARACAGKSKSCSPRMSRLLKTPLYYEIRYTVGHERLDVRCNRTLYLVGDHECRLVDN